MAAARRRAKGNGSIYRQPGSPYWYMAYWVDGQRKIRSTRQTEKADAAIVLDEKILHLRQTSPDIPADEAEWSFEEVAQRWLKTKMGSGMVKSLEVV